MTETFSKDNSSSSAKGVHSNAAFLTAVARPPHDPMQIPLDFRVGWRWRDEFISNMAVSALDGALTIAADPDSGRQLNEASGSFGGVTTPPNVALGPDNSLFLLDWSTGHLRRFDPCKCVFETVPCTGGFGHQPRQLAALAFLGEDPGERPPIFPGVGICGGNLFVADPGNHRMLVFSLHGFALRGFWSPPAEIQTQAWQPSAIAFDQRGFVLVADAANGCVHLFNHGGRWIRCIAGTGAVRAMATDCSQRLYLFSGPDHPVVVYDLMQDKLLGPVHSHEHVVGKFAQLPLAVNQEGCLHLSGLCVRQTGSNDVFDLYGNPVVGGSDNRLAGGHGFAQQASYICTALDSRLYQCQWDRVSLTGAVPDGSRIKVYTYTAETELSADQILNLGAHEWATAKTVFPGQLELPGEHFSAAAGWDCLIRSEPGRFLWLRLEMLGDGNVTPRIARVLVDFPRISLRRYLPAVLGEERVSADFTDRFLAIFDRGFRSVESQLDHLAGYFDPLSAPAGQGRDGGRKNFLAWLASWIGVTLDRQLPLERQRRILQQAGKLFPLRGTFCGLRKNLQLYLGMDQIECRQRSNCAPCTAARPPAWQLPQMILEHYQLRRWMFLGAGRLGDQSRLWGQSIVNRSQLSGPQTHGNAQLGVSQLHSAQDPFRDPMHVYAHKFSVFVPGCIGRSPQRRKSLERLIELEKPAHTAHQLIFVEPRFRIGVQSMIGFDAVIGCYPEGVLLDHSGLGKASILGPAVRGGPELRIGQQSRIGSTRMN